jgi:hypothetical protein
LPNSLGKALSVVEALRSACIDPWRNKERLKFWDNDAATTLDKFKADKVPGIVRSTVEAAVGDYLAPPYRCKAMDRLLIRILIGMEFYTFGNLMLNRGFLSTRSPIKQPHVLASYLTGLAVYGGVSRFMALSSAASHCLHRGLVRTDGSAARLQGGLRVFVYFYLCFAARSEPWRCRSLGRSTPAKL